MEKNTESWGLALFSAVVWTLMAVLRVMDALQTCKMGLPISTKQWLLAIATIAVCVIAAAVFWRRWWKSKTANHEEET